MKINGGSIAPISAITAIQQANSIRKKITVSDSDQVSVSDKGQTFNDLLQKAKALPAVREERVQEISGQINAGIYNIEPSRIAAALRFQAFNLNITEN
ncbi:MAG: flagellar biosynthesis anti-sigma factor FlgM [Peptococcaceae bacterium]|jgi:negative regulator of flagellin synthesis FlgM|nr:flagellar biosynthesis anti-sigma factor FlgM [Peptococcaceae bacterium]